MPPSLSPRQIDLYRQSLQGQRKLIAWGLRESFHFQRWQEQYALQSYVDADYKKWDTVFNGYAVRNPLALRDDGPDTHSVVDNYRIEWISDYVKRVSGMETLPPMPLQHIMHAIAGGTASPRRIAPMPQQQWRHLYEKLAPALVNYDAGPGGQDLGAPSHFQKNLDLLSPYHWTACVAGIAATLTPQEHRDDTVVLVGNSLCSGGAERQMVNLALGFQKDGWNAISLSVSTSPNAPHYVELLQKHGIPIHHVLKDANGIREAEFMRNFMAQQSAETRLALWHLPVDFTIQVASAMLFFQKTRPKLVVAYLDWPSAVAGMAAILCGVPHIVVSGRNYPPSYFPHFFRETADLFHDVYRILSLHPRVHFSNNSSPAGAAYARWLGLKPSQITFIPNCLTEEFMSSPAKADIESIKKKFGIKKTDKTILGVFRLSKEKRPEKFIAVIAALVKRDKNIHAVICGDGPMRGDLEKTVLRKKLEKHVHFAGVTSEIRELMAAADILLHTAAFEGMPNVLLEAQAQGLPVVCTQSGGVLDCLAPELAPYSFPKNDWEKITAAARKLLNSPALREKLGRAAKKHARREYSIPKLVARTQIVAQLPPTQIRKRA